MNDRPAGGGVPVGTMSRDGRFRWDGRQWVEVGVWNVSSTAGQPPPDASPTAPPAAPSARQPWPRPPIPPPSGPPPSPVGEGSMAPTEPPSPQSREGGGGVPWGTGAPDSVSGTSASAGVPRTGAFSQDGAFRWLGDRWEPVRRGRVATGWTRKLQYLMAAYCVLAGLADIVITPIFHNQTALTKTYSHATLPSGVSPQQAASEAIVAATIFAIVVGVIYLLLALASLRGWNWVWWIVGVGLVFGLISFFTNIGSLTNLSSSLITLPGLIINQVVSVIAIVLLALFIWVTIKFGPWAKVKPQAGRS